MRYFDAFLRIFFFVAGVVLMTGLGFYLDLGMRSLDVMGPWWKGSVTSLFVILGTIMSIELQYRWKKVNE